MKLLAIGEGAAEFAAGLYEDADIDVADLTPSKKQTDYDVIIAFNCLTRIPFRKVKETAMEWMRALKPGGEMAILYPSLEWAAEQILSDKTSPVLLLHLFGTQQTPRNFYCSAFTLFDGRGLCSDIGLKITHAATGSYMIDTHECEMHTIRGVKP
jgi:hypothetical protein